MRSDAVIRAEHKAPRRSKVGPLASFGNAVIGTERKSDAFDSVVTVHQTELRQLRATQMHVASQARVSAIASA
jgi:hypothetical protein